MTPKVIRYKGAEYHLVESASYTIKDPRFSADLGQYYHLSGSDWKTWFYTISKNKTGTYKGFMVTWYEDKRVPSKAAIKSEMMGSPWSKVDEGEVPQKVLQRIKDRL